MDRLWGRCSQAGKELDNIVAMLSTFLSCVFLWFCDLSGSRSAFAKDHGRAAPTDSGTFSGVFLLLPMRLTPSACGPTWLVSGSHVFRSMFGCSGLCLVASQAQDKAETQRDREPRSDAVGSLLAPVRTVEYWPQETHLSNEPDSCLPSFGCSL